MNFTQSFQEFSAKLGPVDLALYAGIGIVLWVLFKDQLTPIQTMVLDFIKQLTTKKNSSPDVVKSIEKNTERFGDKDLFFDLVVSWKQTRDLALRSGCEKAVEVADQMFPYLSPEGCEDKESTDVK